MLTIFVGTILLVSGSCAAASTRNGGQGESETLGTASSGRQFFPGSSQISSGAQFSEVLSLTGPFNLLKIFWNMLTMMGSNGTMATLGRSSHVPFSPSLAHMRWIATYVTGIRSGDYGCLSKLACGDPTSSEKQLRVSRMLLKGIEAVESLVPIDGHYKEVLQRVSRALHVTPARDCARRHSCDLF